MLLNKKGDWGTVSKWIYALIIISILWIVFVNFGGFLYDSGNKAACKNWVYRNSITYLKEAIGDFENSPCVTTEEKIKRKDSDQKIYEELAKNMYDCWDQYGRGEVDFYSDYSFGLSKGHCRVCSEIKLDESFKEDKEFDLDEFEIYLSNYNPPNHKETYAEFFIKAEHAKLNFGDGKVLLDRDYPLFIMFVVNKMSPVRAADNAGDAAFGLAQTIGQGVLETTIGMFFLDELGLGNIVRKVAGGGANVFTKIIFQRGASGKISKLPDFSKGSLENAGIDIISKKSNNKLYGNAARGAVRTGSAKVVNTKIPKIKGGIAAVAIGTTAYVLSDASVLVPSLFLISSRNTEELKDVCDYIYYQPEEKLLNA